MNPSEEKRVQEMRDYWDQAAAGFDAEPDHGLRDPAVRKAWTDLLRAKLPSASGSILDIGCGTGSLSVVLAGLGWEVTGIDVSPEMIALAKAKAAKWGYPIRYQVMDAAFPQFQPQQFNGIVCRHLLWALPEPENVLRRWAGLLVPGGYLHLIEGFWHTGSGLHAEEIVSALPASFRSVSVQSLSDQPDLWGGPVSDERFIITAQLTSTSSADAQ